MHRALNSCKKTHFIYTFYHCTILRKKDCTKLKMTSSPAETASTCSSQARPSLSPSSNHRWLAGAKVCLGFIKEDNLISGEPNFWFGSKNFYTFPTDVSPLVGVRLFTMEHSSQDFTRFDLIELCPTQRHLHFEVVCFKVSQNIFISFVLTGLHACGWE